MIAMINSYYVWCWSWILIFQHSVIIGTSICCISIKSLGALCQSKNIYAIFFSLSLVNLLFPLDILYWCQYILNCSRKYQRHQETWERLYVSEGEHSFEKFVSEVAKDEWDSAVLYLLQFSTLVISTLKLTIPLSSNWFVSRSALEILETEVRGSTDQEPQGPVPEDQLVSIYVHANVFSLRLRTMQISRIHRSWDLIPLWLSLITLQVKMDHMVAALSKTFKSPVVDTIQSLPQHQQVSYITTQIYWYLLLSGDDQIWMYVVDWNHMLENLQIIVCCAAKAFRGSKKDKSIAEVGILHWMNNTLSQLHQSYNERHCT